MIEMNKNVTEAIKTNKTAAPDLSFQPHEYSHNPAIFQIFFLSPDQNQTVEVVETKYIDFEEIIERLKIGESIFIKSKDQKILEPPSRMTKEEEQEIWYFTHY